MSFEQWPGHHMAPQMGPFPYPPPDPCFQPNKYIYVKQNFINPNPTPKVLINPHFRQKVYVNPDFNPQKPPVKPKIHVNPNMFKNLAAATPKPIPKVENKPTKVILTRNKFLRVPLNEKPGTKKRRSLHTKYKIVRNSEDVKVKSPNWVVNKFKIDKRTRRSVRTSVSRPSKKKYVYINRFLSISVMAKNVLLKQNVKLKRPGFVNINGILYRKSPNSLRRESEPLSKSKYKIVRKQMSLKEDGVRSLVKRFKIIRSKKQVKIFPSKMKKCNVPCPVYRKFGRCNAKEQGKCIKLHNPDQIVLCTRFLQGACLKDKCLLSHKVSLEKMPTCKYYLEGLCSKDNCPYLHVKISPKADICRDFLDGFCKEGAKCDKRHQLLCPEYEKSKSCGKKRCPYPHGNMVRNRKVVNNVVKKSSTKLVKKAARNSRLSADKIPSEKTTNRYYCDSDSVPKLQEDSSGACQVKDRPKLGNLPAFIPLFGDTS